MHISITLIDALIYYILGEHSISIVDACYLRTLAMYFIMVGLRYEKVVKSSEVKELSDSMTNTWKFLYRLNDVKKKVRDICG